MLLKSCAMPPASLPIDSSFCAWSSWASAALRPVMSTTVAKTWGPAPVSSAERLISTGNSRPSRRRADRSSPIPIGLATGLAVNAARWVAWPAAIRSGSRSSTG